MCNDEHYVCVSWNIALPNPDTRTLNAGNSLLQNVDQFLAVKKDQLAITF